MDAHSPLPESWEQLVAIKDQLQDANRTFLRFDEEKNDYIVFCTIIPKELQLKLITMQLGQRDAGLLVNRYPYTRLLQHLPSVKHWSLWCKSKVLSDAEISEIVSQKFPSKRWIAVESTVKSIPEIWHTHVFVEERV